MQLIENFIKLQGLRVFHGDFGSGKVLLTSQNQVLISDFAPIKPFSLQAPKQSPIEFYQLWFDEGLDGDLGEIGRGCYLAPERLKFNSSSSTSFELLGAADLFSLGCVLAELFSENGETFLQFKNVLSLSSKSKGSDACENLIDEFLKRIRVKNELCPLIKKLCSQDPLKRSLSALDIENLKSMIDVKLKNWREFVNLYRLNEGLNFFAKKELIIKKKCEAQNLDPKQVETLCLLILRENEALLRILLVDLLFKVFQNNENFNFDELLKALNVEENLMIEDLVIRNLLSMKNFNFHLNEQPKFSLIKAFSNFNLKADREALFQQILKEPDLKKVLYVLEVKNCAREKVKDVLVKLLQIYRARGLRDFEFERQLAFWFFAVNIEEEEVMALFDLCNLTTPYQLHRPVKKDQLGPAATNRIAYQFDLKKNKIPIEILRNQESLSVTMIANTNTITNTNTNTNINTHSLSRRQQITGCKKLKQRLLIDGIPWKFADNEKCLAILQSPDRSFFLFHSQSTIYFWDIKEILPTTGKEGAKFKSSKREALGAVCPRGVDGVICSVVFSDDNSLFIAFEDGIIGLYK